MPDINKRLDEAITAIKALPRTYQERALLGLRTLLGDWEPRAKQRWDARQQAAKQRWAELNVEFGRRLHELTEVLNKRR